MTRTGLEFSEAERDAVLDLTTGIEIADCSPELLSACAKLKAGASANGMGTAPGGDLSSRNRARGGRSSGHDKPTGSRVGRRVNAEEVERLCHEIRAHFNDEDDDATFTGPQLARVVNVHDHHSAIFKAVIDLLIAGKHISIVGTWRNGPVYGRYAEDAPEEPAPRRPTSELPIGEEPEEEVQEDLEPESGARTSELAHGDDEEPEIPGAPEAEEEDDTELAGVEQALRDIDTDIPLAERIFLLVEERGPLKSRMIAEALGKSHSTIDMLLRAPDLGDRLQNSTVGWEVRSE